MSLVVLIITNEADEHNRSLEMTWRERLVHYRSLYPQMNYYFLKGRPDLIEDCLIDESSHDCFIRVAESFNPGILMKTLKAMEVLSPKYDFTLRPNISSIFLFHRYMRWLKNQPKTGLYAGVPHPFGSTKEQAKWAFGAGYTVSADIARMIANEETLNLKVDNGIIKGTWIDVNDDVFVGYACLYHYKVPLTAYTTVEIFRKEHIDGIVKHVRSNTDALFLRVKMLDGSCRSTVEPQAHAAMNKEIFSSNDL